MLVLPGGKLAGASEGLEEEGSGGEGPELRLVELVSLQAPQLQPGDVLAVSWCCRQCAQCLPLPLLAAKLALPCCYTCSVPHPSQKAPPCCCPLRPTRLLPPTQVDELLQELQVCLSGADAVDAVTIVHPGLTLVPLDEEQVDPAHPLQVLAALVPTADMESGSSSSSSESGSGTDSGGDSSSDNGLEQGP